MLNEPFIYRMFEEKVLSFQAIYPPLVCLIETMTIYVTNKLHFSFIKLKFLNLFKIEIKNYVFDQLLQPTHQSIEKLENYSL